MHKESACSHRPELPEALPGAALNKDQVNKAGALGRSRGSWSSSGTQGQEAGQQQQRVLEAEKEQPLQPGQSPEQLQDPFWHWSHRNGRMLARGEGWLHTPLSPAFTSPRHPWRQTELSTATGWEWPPHLHMGFSLGTGKEGSRSSCPCAPAAKLGQLCLHSKGFPVTPDHSGVPSRRRIPGSPSGCPGGVEQPMRCWAVLSCSSQSGDGHPPWNLLLFLPSPSPCETCCAWFFPALQSPVRQDGA